MFDNQLMLGAEFIAPIINLSFLWVIATCVPGSAVIIPSLTIKMNRSSMQIQIKRTFSKVVFHLQTQIGLECLNLLAACFKRMTSVIKLKHTGHQSTP